jgi:lipopolysaccharide/colanic/teichoic acid biosynthesis glycosyltransferase
MATYHFDYEIAQRRTSSPGSQSRRAPKPPRRAPGLVFLDDTGSGAYYYDLKTRWPVAARIKRVVDILGSTVLITLLAPLFLIIMAAIKLTSPGPIVFRQRRVGFRCNPFYIYKFRTMVDKPDLVVADSDATGVAFKKAKNDPRITPIGGFLRKYSVDELPQLFNVLEGTMSLVGPRPLRDCDVDMLPRRSTLRRFATPPGITGLWQVSGRSNLVGGQALQIDREYVDRWSLGLDFKILLKTVLVVLTGKDSA